MKFGESSLGLLMGVGGSCAGSHRTPQEVPSEKSRDLRTLR